MPFVTHRFTAMASPCMVSLWCTDQDIGQLDCGAVEAEVRRIERKYSRYAKDSMLSRINAAAGLEPIEIDAETSALLDFAEHAWRHSEGRFDPTSGVLRRVWDFRSQRLPDSTALAAVLPLIGWSKLQREAGSIRLPRVGMELDFGGFGKEYAVDRAIGVLQNRGVAHALVNLGGDVRVTAAQADGRPWRVGIQHPRQPATVLATIELVGGALATSGDSERYMEVAGRRYCHLLDPGSGWPVECAQLASTCAPLCLVAGTATTCALLGGTEGYRQLAGRPWLWVDRAGQVSGSLITS